MAKQPLASQAAVIPVRMRDGAIDVALITSIRKRRWIVPKGAARPGEALWDAAAREAEEEAGLLGLVRSDPVGSYSFRRDGIRCEVMVYVMDVTRVATRWAEETQRERAWFALEEAVLKVRRRGLRQILVALRAQVEGCREVMAVGPLGSATGR